LHNLAGAYRDAGRLPEAIKLFEHVRAASETRLGRDHPSTLRTLHNLAAAYWSAKQLDRSIPLFEDVLRWQEAKLGRDHPHTLQTVANLGVNYRDAGRLAEAIPLLEEEYRKGQPHAAPALAGVDLLIAYVRAGRGDMAARLIPVLLATARKHFKPESPELCNALGFHANQWLSVNRPAEAEPLLRECLTICEKAKPTAWGTYNAQALLGSALAGQKKYAEAEPLLVQGCEGMIAREATIPVQGRIYLAQALERLVQLCQAQGKQAEAAKWRAELAARKERAAKPNP
jgi:tetratricopeptide (TPR) repeat protein